MYYNQIMNSYEQPFDTNEPEQKQVERAISANNEGAVEKEAFLKKLRVFLDNRDNLSSEQLEELNALMGEGVLKGFITENPDKKS